MLLSLVAASRVSAIKNLSIKSITRSKDQYIFHFDKLLKSWRNGWPCTLVTYNPFPRNAILCAVRVLNEYIKRVLVKIRTRPKFCYLSTIIPHKPVVSSTISSWLKKVLSNARININIFKTHYTRSALASSAMGHHYRGIIIIIKGELDHKRLYGKDIIRK